MFCGKCGAKINDNETVCPSCGNVIENNSGRRGISVDAVKEKIRTLPGTYLVLIILGIAAVIVAAAVFVYASLPSNKILNLIKKGEYQEAEELYYETYKDGKTGSGFNNKVLKIAEQCQQDYIDSKISDGDAFELIRTLDNLDIDKIEDELDDISSAIELLSTEKYDFSRAEEYYQDGNYLKAINCYRNISNSSPLFEDAASKIKSIEAEYKAKALEEVDKYISNDRPNDLARYIKNDINDINDSSLTAEAMEKYCSYLKSKTEKLLNDNLYDDAVSVLNDAQSYFSDEQRIKNMIAELENTYVDNSLKRAEEEFNSGNYESAASTVQIAMEQVEGREELSNKYNEYKTYLPAYLNDLDYFNKKGDIYTNSYFDRVSDNTGKEYARAYCVDGAGTYEFYAEYLLNNNYTNFTGVCGVAYDVRENEETKFFEVYGDGVLIYTSPTFKAGVMPQNFDINVSGVKILKISYPATKGKNKIATIFDGKIYNQNNIKTNQTSETESTT